MVVAVVGMAEAAGVTEAAVAMAAKGVDANFFNQDFDKRLIGK